MTLEEALKKIALLEGVTKELDDKLSVYKSKDIDTLESKVKSYEDLGSLEDIEALIQTAEEMKDELNKYRELGEADELDDALESMVIFTENFKEKLGDSIEQVEEALNTSKATIEAYAELGSIDDINELIATAESLNESLKEYSTLLTVDEAQAIVESYEDDLQEIQVAKLTESFNVSEAFAIDMLNKWGSFEDAEKALSEVAGSLKINETEDDVEKKEEGEDAKTDESVAPAKSIRTRLHSLLGL